MISGCTDTYEKIEMTAYSTIRIMLNGMRTSKIPDDGIDGLTHTTRMVFYSTTP